MLGALAAEAARRFGERVAFVDGRRSLTFRELDRASDELAAGLRRRGVGAGDVIALALPTCLEYPVHYLAAAKLGAVTAGVNTRLPTSEQERLVDRVNARLVVSEDSTSPGSKGERLTLAETDRLRVPGGTPPPLAPNPDRPVTVVFTSGTTGPPKGAVFGDRQLDAIRAVDIGPEWGAGGALLLGTSLSHLGFMTKLGGALQSGRTNHLLRRWRADDALRLTATLGLTSLSGVPTQLALMLADPTLDDVDLAALRLVLIGGGPATPALVRSARERLGVPVCTRYSCTEAGIGCGTSPGDPPEDAEETVGRPQPGVELAIRVGDDDVPPGEVGEVLLRSAAAMSGYWDDPVATAAARTVDGYVRTGDLGRVDEHGRLRLTGRSKEIYVRGGYNVHPVTVEAVLAEHPRVRAVAVVPLADDVMGEIGVAVVVANGAPPELGELRTFGSDRLARHELPERLLVVDRLPLTAGDKVDRRALREVAAASVP